MRPISKSLLLFAVTALAFTVLFCLFIHYYLHLSVLSDERISNDMIGIAKKFESSNAGAITLNEYDDPDHLSIDGRAMLYKDDKRGLVILVIHSLWPKGGYQGFVYIEKITAQDTLYRVFNTAGMPDNFADRDPIRIERELSTHVFEVYRETD